MRSQESGKSEKRAANTQRRRFPVSLAPCFHLFPASLFSSLSSSPALQLSSSFLALALWFPLLAAPTPQAPPPASLTLRWQPGVYHIGDVIPFEVAVPVASREFYIQGELAEGEEWGPAVITKVRQVLPDRFPGLVVLSGEAQVFQLGSASFPPLRLGVHLASATQAYTVQSPALAISPLLPKGDQPRPPFAAPIPIAVPFPWGLALGGLLAASALAYGIRVWARRRRARRLQPRAALETRETDPDRWVKDEIDKIFRAPLEPPQRYQRLSEVLRDYLSLKFARPYLEWTTGEVSRGLSEEAALEGPFLEDVLNLFSFCDLAMFARYRPLPEEERDAREIALELVDLVSKPPELEKAS